MHISSLLSPIHAVMLTSFPIWVLFMVLHFNLMAIHSKWIEAQKSKPCRFKQCNGKITLFIWLNHFETIHRIEFMLSICSTVSCICWRFVLWTFTYRSVKIQKLFVTFLNQFLFLYWTKQSMGSIFTISYINEEKWRLHSFASKWEIDIINALNYKTRLNCKTVYIQCQNLRQYQNALHILFMCHNNNHIISNTI